ncbi:hypothetical protein AMJ52_05670 [candidate division TA06 bacterium DG_78]|uniref:FlgD Ig-like domain-containing protein n=1 Tax=candidate division TA06 bacterium DG_78 TaxID=1703772 RepID=A0A0S7YDE4_UNCT6|nr:MAG: hypothetical protein AMJ52_05670 [candidate division TA06 bacterium DG_78]
MSQDIQAVKIEIFDNIGRKVLQFMPDESIGYVIWRGDDDSGNRLPSGVYFLRFSSLTAIKTIPIVLLR